MCMLILSYIFANYLNLKVSRGLRGWCSCVANFNGLVQFQYVANFPLSLWYVCHMFKSANINLEPLIHLLFHMGGHCSPYQNIHVTLDFFHEQFKVATQIVHMLNLYLPNTLSPNVATLNSVKKISICFRTQHCK